jgi:hypothetical protein
MSSKPPSADAPFSVWCWYILALPTKEERNAALEKCPEDIREATKDMVQRMYKLIVR